MKDLADLLHATPNEVIRNLIKHGVFASINQVVEYENAIAAGHDLPLAGPRVDQLLERMDINVALAGRLAGRIRGVMGAGAIDR